MISKEQKAKDIIDNTALTDNQKINKLQKLGFELEDIFTFIMKNYK